MPKTIGRIVASQPVGRRWRRCELFQPPEGMEASVNEMAAEHLLRSQLGARLLEPVVVSLPASHAVPRVVGTIKDIVMRHPGPFPVHLRLSNGSRTDEMELPVTVADTVRAELRSAFGPHVCEAAWVSSSWTWRGADRPRRRR